MSQARARRWLARLWAGSDLTLVPYEKPAPPPRPKAPAPAPEDGAGDSRELKMKARLDALLSIAPPRVSAGSSGSSGSSGSGSSSSSSSSAPKKRPLKIDVQGARHTQGVAVVDHLYKLGRAPNPKQRKNNRVRTCELLLEAGKDGIDHNELLALQKAQEFSVDQRRPLLIAEAVGQWKR